MEKNTASDQKDPVKKKKGQKKKDKAWHKKLKRIGGGGTSLHSELNPEKDFSEIKITDLKEDGILINLPVNIVLGSQVLERGFYKVIGERDEDSNKMYLNFYQSQFFKGKVEVIETQDDYGEETLDFARILPFNESFVKIIYGSIDFNAYTYLPYSN